MKQPVKAPKFLVREEAQAQWSELQEQLSTVTDLPCAGPNAHLWWGNLVHQTAAAEACTPCPVKAACLAYATAAGERHGTWGGRTEFDL